jgi:uroporphyrinogen-III synthase
MKRRGVFFYRPEEGMPHLIVLKPGEDGRALYEALLAGGAPESRLHFWPAYEIEPASDSADAADVLRKEAGSGSLIIPVSPSAVHVLAGCLSGLPAGARFAAVGKGSADRILEIRPDATVLYPEGKISASGTEALLEVFERTGYPKRAVICRGQSGRELLADTLREKGCEVRILTVYGRRDLDLSGSERAWFEGFAGGAVLFITNSDAQRVLDENFSAEGRLKLRRTPVVTIHERIREKLLKAGFTDVRIVESGEAQSFLLSLF